MTYACTEILKDIIFCIAIINGFGSEKVITYETFGDWTTIDFNLPEVRKAYNWLVENGYIGEFMNDRHSDEEDYHKIRATKKTWEWAKANNVAID